MAMVQLVLLVLLVLLPMHMDGAPVVAGKMSGSAVADLQVIGRWPAFAVARLASDVLWNMKNSSGAHDWEDSGDELEEGGAAGRREDAALRAVVARLCDEASDAAAGVVEQEVAAPETMWVGGARTWASYDPCTSIPGGVLVSCRGSCVPRAQCYPTVRVDPCSLLGASGPGFTECHGGCVPRGRCVHVFSTPAFELSAYIGTPSALENRSLAGGALMLPPGTLGEWNETAARLATMSFFNLTSRRWQLNASAVEPSAPPPVTVCAVRWHGNYMPRRRRLRQHVTLPLPNSAYQPSRALEQNVTVQTEVVSLLVRGVWSRAHVQRGAETALLQSEPLKAQLLLPAGQPLPEAGRAPAREQRGIFRYCGRWGAALPESINATNATNTTNATENLKEVSSQRWLLDQLDEPEVLTEFVARAAAALPVLLPAANSSNCTNATGANATNLTACNTTALSQTASITYEYARTDAAHCRISIDGNANGELFDVAVLAGSTRWAPIVPVDFAYMASRPELSAPALLVSLCSFVLYGTVLAGSIQFRRTIKAQRAAIPGWIKQTAYARQLKHDLHPVLSVRTVLHTLRTRWSLPAATFPGPMAGDPFDFSQRLLVVITATMAALGSTAVLGSTWRQESCLAPCSAMCYSQTDVVSTATPLSWTIRTDRDETWHRDQYKFGDCDEVCGTKATVPVQLPSTVVAGGVLFAQLTCSVVSVLFRWLAEPYLEYLAPEHVESVTVRACRWTREWLPVAATFDFCGAVRRELVEICHICWHRKPQKRIHAYTKRAFEGKMPVSMPHGDEKYGKEGIHSDTYQVGIRTFHKRLYPSSWAAAAIPYGVSAAVGIVSFGLAIAGSTSAGDSCEIWASAWLRCATMASFLQLVIVDPVIAVGRMLVADCLHVGRWKKVVPEVKQFTTEEISSLFEELDTNQSGALERNEVLALCKKLESGLLGVQFSEDDLEGAWHEMDADGKGDVSLGEFLAWWNASGSSNLGSVGSAVTSVLDGSAVDPTGVGTVTVWQSKLVSALEEADQGRVMRMRVRVVGCASLPPKDVDGRSDVYATLEMIGAFELMEEPLKRTVTLHNSRSDPCWPAGGQTLVFDTLEVPSELEVVVFDEDVASADDLIGTATISLEGKGLAKPSFGGEEHGKVYQEAGWHALTDDRGYPAGSIMLQVHWGARDLTAGKDAAAMEKEYRELDATEQGLRDGDTGALLAIGDAMFDDPGEHEIEEWKQHEDQGVTVGVRGHACESVRQLVGARETLAFNMIRDVLNPFRTNMMTKKQRKRLNIVLTEFLARQSEAAHRGARDWLISAATAHATPDGTDSDNSDGEESLPGTSAGDSASGTTSSDMRPGHRDRTRLPPITGGEAGQAAYRARQDGGRNMLPARPRPGTAQRVRDMANSIQDDQGMCLVFREQAAAKLQLLRRLWEENLITNAVASARQNKVLQELDTAGISSAGLGYRYI